MFIAAFTSLSWCRTTFGACPLPIRERKGIVFMSIRTRFRGRRPLSNLKELALMFLTLILQYLNKLSESKVGDFTSPQAFHTLKVQRLYGNRIKPFAQVGSNLVVPVLALVGYMPIQSRKLSDTTPIIVRTFDFTRKAFAQCSEFFQGVFQKIVAIVSFRRC